MPSPVYLTCRRYSFIYSRLLIICSTMLLGTISIELEPALAQSDKQSDSKPTADKIVNGTAAQQRTAWTTSRFKGTPEPPLPLSIEPAFTKLKFNDPMHVRWQPDVERYFVCELGGKIWSFPDDMDRDQTDLVVDLKSSLKSFDPERSGGCENVYSLVFDPDFKTNRFVYICMTLTSKTNKPLPDGSRISRFRLTESNPPKLDMDSELPIITWLAGGHNGCDLAFDNSGCLLFSTGDATEPSPPDKLATGQDVSDLLSSVLRIDVRGASPDRPYKIPPDNPLQEIPNAKPEIWAFGFRNPWRMSIDEPTGQLWLGDVGWEKWELVHRVERGGNYGWSVREGHELIQPNAPVGPGTIRPPRVALPHADAASITGGFVYRGQAIPTLQGQYIFGDWVTGRIWSVPLDDDSAHQEIASGQLRIIAFSPDRHGEPLVVNHLANTTLFRLVPNKEFDSQLAHTKSFPQRLSETGLFTDVRQQLLSPGVRQFTVNHPQWLDGAKASHYLALPDRESVTVYKDPRPVGAVAMFNSRLHYPTGTVLARTLTFPGMRTDTKTDRSERRVETQVLHFDGRLWRGYSYVWNEDETDADLAPVGGLELTLPNSDGQRWRIHSRTECMQCHNPWPETTLAFTPEQLHQPDRGSESEWLRLVAEGYVVTQDPQKRPIQPESCVRQPLAARNSRDVSLAARAYLHVNCSHCHQMGAGAAVDLSLKITDNLPGLKAVDVAPGKGTFAIDECKLIAAGDAARSALIYRMASSSIGRMPHIGSREVDLLGVALVADWINSLKSQAGSADSKAVDSKAVDRDEKDQSDAKHAAEHGVEGRARLLVEMLTAQEKKATDSAVGAEAATSESLRSESVRAALGLTIDYARQFQEPSEGGSAISQQPLSALIKNLAHSSEPLVSSLFEAYLPPQERLRRLGTGATFADVADITGDVTRGQQWFFDTSRSQCAKCHRIGERGGQVGPALTQVGKKATPAQLFESLADPSRIIEPKYQTHIVVTGDGKVVTGLLESESASEMNLTDAQGQRHTIEVSEIESRRLDSQSIMPSGLASELTAQQVADLLAYLMSLQ